ncbi:MAG: hypothetical protein IJ806_06075 [Ruminococcus sp.]|nr:hypothetical protein [Ruminococcus sp.]
MIKGINKQIIEIKCTDSEYFEKALLFVEPSRQFEDSAVLKAQALDFARSLSQGEKLPLSRRLLKEKNLRTAAALFFGTVLAGLIGFFVFNL